MESFGQEKRRILVTGATGNQGAAVIKALVALGAANIEILALTRNTASLAAQELASLSPFIKLHKGDFSDCSAIFSNAPGQIYGVYSVQTDQYGSPESIAQGEIQGRAMIEAALTAGVKVFVQASGDRGGTENSDVNPTSVPQFITKFIVENHLKRRVAETNGRMTFTILRPSSFMENCGSDLHGQGFSTMWNCMGRPLQFISTIDVGILGARALLEANSPDFRNKAISLAGDELTFAEAAKIFKDLRGKSMPKSPAIIGTLVKWTQPEIKSMFLWFENVGFKADIAECKRIHPGLLDFASWLKQTDRYGKRS